jgi:hypothetical protein
MTLREQLDCARRELALRKSVYPKWVRENRMTPTKAAHEIAAMEAIHATLEKVLMLDEVGIAWAIEAGRTTPA